MTLKWTKGYLGGDLSHEIERIQQYMEQLAELRHEKSDYALTLEKRLDNAVKYKQFIESGGRNNISRRLNNV